MPSKLAKCIPCSVSHHDLCKGNYVVADRSPTIVAKCECPCRGTAKR